MGNKKTPTTYFRRPRICGVYALLNTVTGDTYIGSSLDMIKRIDRHHNNILSGDCQSRIKKAVEEYGAEAFAYVMLEVCEPEERFTKEKWWFDYRQPEYNFFLEAAPNNRNIPLPPELKEIQRISHTGKTISLEHKQAFCYSTKGIPKSEEHKRKCGEAIKAAWARRKAALVHAGELYDE